MSGQTVLYRFTLRGRNVHFTSTHVPASTAIKALVVAAYSSRGL